MKNFLYGIFLLVGLSVFLPEPASAAPDFWIDVRSPEEYAQGHVSGAVNIPHEQIRAQIDSLTNDKEAEIYVYCRSGHRAGLAMNYLQSMGYSSVRNVGGLDDAIELEASP